MAGLSVLLEAQDNFPKRPQIISKTTVVKNPSLSSPPSSPLSPATPFLEHCYLCRKRLVEGKDIYMYRGDRAFCSVMCRCRQMHMDQAAAAAAAAAAAGGSQPARRRERVTGKGRALAC